MGVICRARPGGCGHWSPVLDSHDRAAGSRGEWRRLGEGTQKAWLHSAQLLNVLHDSCYKPLTHKVQSSAPGAFSAIQSRSFSRFPLSDPNIAPNPRNPNTCHHGGCKLELKSKKATQMALSKHPSKGVASTWMCTNDHIFKACPAR